MSGAAMPGIKLYANLRTLTGQSELTLAASDLEQLLQTMIGQYPQLKPFLYEQDELKTRLIITLNGQILDPSTRLQTTLTEQDQIAIFPPVSGG
jgi:sulfur-carrier protein